MSTQFESYIEAINALKDVIGNFNAHSEAAPEHAEKNDRAIAGIECGIAEIERRLAAEMSAMEEHYHENRPIPNVDYEVVTFDDDMPY